MVAVPEILTRAQCGLLPPNLNRLEVATPGQLVGVTVHCTVTPTADPLATWRDIQSAEMRGADPSHDTYGDIAYNAGVTLDGRILTGRDRQWVGAHATSTNNVANRITIGVALIGTGGTITPAAELALRECLALAHLAFGHAPLIFDHLDWRALGGIATSCPDPPTVAFVAQLKAEARQ